MLCIAIHFHCQIRRLTFLSESANLHFDMKDFAIGSAHKVCQVACVNDFTLLSDFRICFTVFPYCLQ